jgi:2Fe-2S ferredoxin
MVKVKFVQADGSQQTVEIAPGLSLMEAAQNSGIPGILADCGGNCSCGTCRVFVDAGWQDKTGAASELEQDMLEMHANRQEGERLSCQLTMTEDLDGLVVSLPASQF